MRKNKILLPDLPYSLLETLSGDEINDVYDYAERAARAAMAAQEPAAWMMVERNYWGDPPFCLSNPARIYKSLYVPLARVPNPDKDSPC
ncbi:hypothetical protein [Achromobacter sp. ACM05]|uniref:hypothetical protein n=1 Tax=Achromobacter sp. ACM05 TaxID=2854776 RepID=UPI001C44D81B|nr:hypothetical protein [Achromobacter sp. ACM05]MBV7502065.1 hypothetical protein [Achromobacter sp. ACM05]